MSFLTLLLYLAVCRTWNPAATQRGAGHENDADRRSRFPLDMLAVAAAQMIV
jgi:hypothetical protein